MSMNDVYVSIFCIVYIVYGEYCLWTLNSYHPARYWTWSCKGRGCRVKSADKAVMVFGYAGDVRTDLCSSYD